MFTGLIQRLGMLRAVEMTSAGGTLRVYTGSWEPALAVGESISVNGVCLTLTRFANDEAEFDILIETRERTSLSAAKIGAELNLERSLRAGDFMGGHVVTGHVDGVGRLARIGRAGRDWTVEVTCEPEVMAGLVSKGSVTLEGISLTIADLAADRFTVHVIPHTWEATNLHARRVGDALNVETDVLGKYVRKYLSGMSASAPAITADRLRDAGFA